MPLIVGPSHRISAVYELPLRVKFLVWQPDSVGPLGGWSRSTIALVMHTLTIMPLSCMCGIFTPILRICSICSGDIFGMFFISSDFIVMAHRPGFIWSAADTAADAAKIENATIDRV